MIRLPGNIPLYINPSFWLLCLLIAWLNGPTPTIFLQWIAIVFVSVLVHELGHAWTALYWGQRSRIELGVIGGVTIRQGGSLSKGKEFSVILMGPLFGFLLCGVSFSILMMGVTNAEWVMFLQRVVWANIFWTVLNLLPVQPLDGGKLVAVVLDMLFGPKGIRFSYLLSTIFAILFAALFLIWGLVIAGALFLLCGFESYRSWQNTTVVESTENDMKVFEEITAAQRDWASHHPERAISRLEAMVSQEKEGKAFLEAVDLLANYLLSSGRAKQAYALLEPLKDTLSIDTLKQLQHACYRLSYWEEALQVGETIFREEQDPSCAIFNAFSAAHLSRVQTVSDWLTYLKESGTVDMGPILESDDFDAIRSDPLFQKFA